MDALRKWSYHSDVPSSSSWAHFSVFLSRSVFRLVICKFVIQGRAREHLIFFSFPSSTSAYSQREESKNNSEWLSCKSVEQRETLISDIRQTEGTSLGDSPIKGDNQTSAFLITRSSVFSTNCFLACKSLAIYWKAHTSPSLCIQSPSALLAIALLYHPASALYHHDDFQPSPTSADHSGGHLSALCLCHQVLEVQLGNGQILRASACWSGQQWHRYSQLPVKALRRLSRRWSEVLLP